FTRDGDAIAYATTERNGVDYDVFVQDIESGAVRRVFEGTFGFYARGWAPDGRHLLMSETRGEDGNNLYLLDTETGEADTLFKPEVSSEYQNFEWMSDGSGFYLNTNHDREFHALAFYDLADRELQLLDTPDHDVGNVVLFGGDRYLAWTINEGGYDRLRFMALAGPESGVALDGPTLPLGVYNLSGARDAASLAIRISGPRTPGEVWLWHPEDADAERVINATLAGIDPTLLSAPEVVSFEARDGVSLHGLLYRPADSDARAPLMLKVHGGPTGQARPRFDAVAQYLVGRGYAVFDFNFRGSTGYGKTFARLDNGRLRPDAVGDIQDAVDWLGDNADVDPTRMAIMGGSYGGYLTNAAVGSYPGLFKAAVSFVGVSDWVRALEEASPALKASDRVEYGDINDPDDRAFFAEISPLSRAHLVRTPLLVVHGANDPRDPVGESDRFVQAVREQEVEVRYLRFADEGHGLRKLGNRITAYREIADFLDSKLN
ncbi:MAG: S9 family peptidase, partial [Pseudomonadota bacterium]